MLELVPILLATTFVAGIVQGISGFAFAIIFLAVMQSYLPYTELLSVSAILCVIMLSANVLTHRHHIIWRWLPVPIITTFVFTIGSVYFLNLTADFPYWKKLLGVVFILMSVYLFIWQHRIHIQPTARNAVLFCGLGGILGGLFGVGGPPPVLYFLSITDDKEVYISTGQTFFLFNMTADLIGRILNGNVTTVTVQYAACCFWTVLLGLWIGNKIFGRINAETLKKIVYLIMFLDGWYMLFFG